MISSTSRISRANTLNVMRRLNLSCLVLLATGFATPTYGQGKAAFVDAQDEVSAGFLFQNVNIYDGKSDELEIGRHVLIVNNKIQQISDQVIPLEGVQNISVIEGESRTLMPGLIDMHSHIGISVGVRGGREDYDSYAVGAMSAMHMLSYLDQGFTTARDTGGPTEGVAKLVMEGKLKGPRIYSSSAIISPTAGHGDFGSWADPAGFKDQLELAEMTRVVDGRPEILKAVRENLRKGAAQIKFTASGGVSSSWDPIHGVQFSLDEMKAIVETAADWDTYVLIHANTDLAVNRAIDAGVRCVEHGLLLSEDTVKRMANEGVALSLQAQAGYVAWMNVQDKLTPTFKELSTNLKNVARWAKKYGVLIVTGGDKFGSPASVGSQFQNVLAAEVMGFTAAEALRMSTSNAGIVLGWTGKLNPYPGKLGVVEEGAYADLLLVDGNPLDELNILDNKINLRVIMKNGEIYKNSL